MIVEVHETIWYDAAKGRNEGKVIMDIQTAMYRAVDNAQHVKRHFEEDDTISLPDHAEWLADAVLEIYRWALAGGFKITDDVTGHVL